MKKGFSILILMLVLTLAFTTAAAAQDDLKEFDVFISVSLPDYSGSSIVGDIIQEETGVKLNREYLVGDLEQKVGLMIASQDYPDMLVAAHFTDKFVEAGALIPLEDLINKHAPNIKKYYAKHLDALRKEDGHIYYLPQLAIPFEPAERRYPSVGFFVNKRVLEANDYPFIKSLDQYFKLIEDYQKEHPEYNGQKTIGYTTLFDGWRRFATTNGPMHLMGYPNEGGFVPVKEGEEYVVRPYYGSNVEKYYYKKLNEMYSKGIIDPEAFIANYDQYLQKISSGRVLGTLNQYWQIQQAQEVLINEKPDSIMVPFPVTYDPIVEEHIRDKPYVQTTQGMGITTACEDPVAAIKYLDYLVSIKTQHLIQWGIKGKHYQVDENGMFYRTEEQLAKFRDPNWVRDVFGRHYFYNAFPSLTGLGPNGNSFMPSRQPSAIYANSSESEKEVMDAYGVKSFTGLYNKPFEGRKYFPLWTITLPTNSKAQIESTRMSNALVQHIPTLVMDSPEKFQANWDAYSEKINGLMDAQIKYYQKRIDWRMKNW
ncbi:MAG: extracellular solute-binding protein [Halanaerobiales bacterium]|nr:extracellular solute-binding protein [Halanaerobiales bacterium]